MNSLLQKISIFCLFCIFIGMGGLAQEPAKASQSELGKVDYFLKRLEANAERAKGKPFMLSYDDKEAVNRVSQLQQKYPQDAEVEKLVQRARNAVPWHFQEKTENQTPADKPKSTNEPQANSDDLALKNEIVRADYFLKLLEDKVNKSYGEPFKIGYEGEEALKRIFKLNQKHPDKPEIKELFQRAHKALLASKGSSVEITPEMLAFRENEKKLKAAFAAEAEKSWQHLKEKITGMENTIQQPFPTVSHREATMDEMVGRHVILEEFVYPANEFTDMSRQFVFVGSGVKGHYYVELSNRSWLSVYEAIRRYRRLVNRDIPDNGKWTVAAKVIGLELLVPQAGQDKTTPAAWGWSVEPLAIYIPGCTLAVVDAKLELGGSFACEERMEEIKAPMYSVTAISEDVTPEKLVEIFSIAIREKNYHLYLECIDPERRNSGKALQYCAYHWEWHQHRFANFYVHIVVGKADIKVVQGFNRGNELENAFLSEEDKANLRKISEPLVEQAQVKSFAYDERGRQYGSPKTFFLKRQERGRWYITSYAQPF
jgi:hypothetical protein